MASNKYNEKAVLTKHDETHLRLNNSLAFLPGTADIIFNNNNNANVNIITIFARVHPIYMTNTEQCQVADLEPRLGLRVHLNAV